MLSNAHVSKNILFTSVVLVVVVFFGRFGVPISEQLIQYFNNGLNYALFTFDFLL